MENISRFKQF